MASKLFDQQYVAIPTAEGRTTISHGLFQGEEKLHPHHIVLNWRWDPGSTGRALVTRATQTEIDVTWSGVVAPSLLEVTSVPFHSFQATPTSPWRQSTVSPRGQ